MFTDDELKRYYEHALLSDGSMSTPPKWKLDICTKTGFANAYMAYCEKVRKVNKTYRYMLLFTFDPKKPSFKATEEYYNATRDYIDNLATSKQYTAIHWASCREYHESGIAHYHISVISTTCIKQSYFNYYKRIYGNVIVNPSKKDEKEFALNYMEKDFDYRQII